MSAWNDETPSSDFVPVNICFAIAGTCRIWTTRVRMVKKTPAARQRYTRGGAQTTPLSQSMKAVIDTPSRI